MTPDEEADQIIAKLLSDLPKERQEAVKDAIVEACQRWGDVISSITGVE